MLSEANTAWMPGLVLRSVKLSDGDDVDRDPLCLSL